MAEVPFRSFWPTSIETISENIDVDIRRKRKNITYETNPKVRRKRGEQLLKKLDDLVGELSAKTGLQAVVMTTTEKAPRSKAKLKVFGAQPLKDTIKKFSPIIMRQLELETENSVGPSPKNPPSFLPELIFDDVLVPLEQMTQAQLRNFIPVLLKWTTNQPKPGWGVEGSKPIWWPKEVPWQNIRVDGRNQENKRELPWKSALRLIVYNCYQHYGEIDKLQLSPNFGVFGSTENSNMVEIFGENPETVEMGAEKPNPYVILEEPNGNLQELVMVPLNIVILYPNNESV